MDQQPQPAQAPQPPQPPQPPQGPQPPMGPQQPNPYGAPQPSGGKKTGLIVGIIIAAVLLIGGGVTALVITLNNKDNKSSSQSSSNSSDSSKKDDSSSNSTADDEKVRAANATTAKYVTDFNKVCETASISNAADYAKPYKIAAFYDSVTGSDYWTQVSLPYDANYKADYDKFETTNVVACLSPDKTSAVKSKTCDFKSGSDTVSIDYYALKYNVSLYEAKSGKKIKDLGTVNGPADTCPSFVSYNKSDPKVYAKPDAQALGDLLATFAS